MITKLKDLGRMGGFAVIGLIIMAVVMMFYPAQLAVFGWTLGKITIAATLGYWIDRIAFKGTRPHEVELLASSQSLTNYNQTMIRADQARLRRAIVIAATVLAIGVAV